MEDTGPRCLCDPEFSPSEDGLGCVDPVDECLVDNGGCDPLTACYNRPGYVECGGCPYGYEGSGDTECVEQWWSRCERFCEFENECFGADRFMGLATASDCHDACLGTERLLQDPCDELYLAVGECEAAIGCTAAKLFAEDYRAHPDCGAAYTELVVNCGIDAGVAPPGCRAFCANAELCVPDRVGGGCPDNCALTLGILGRVWAQDCSSESDDYLGCLGGLECGAFPSVPSVVPSACAIHDYNARSACQ